MTITYEINVLGTPEDGALEALDEAIRNNIEAIEETYGVSIGLIVTEEK